MESNIKLERSLSKDLKLSNTRLEKKNDDYRLAEESPEKAELVKLRYFAGMSLVEAAEALGISRATASRHWAYSKLFLYCELEDREPKSG